MCDGHDRGLVFEATPMKLIMTQLAFAVREKG
jgi:hypothetical protein